MRGLRKVWMMSTIRRWSSGGGRTRRAGSLGEHRAAVLLRRGCVRGGSGADLLRVAGTAFRERHRVAVEDGREIARVTGAPGAASRQRSCRGSRRRLVGQDPRSDVMTPSAPDRLATRGNTLAFPTSRECALNRRTSERFAEPSAHASDDLRQRGLRGVQLLHPRRATVWPRRFEPRPAAP